jgi:Small primase-like proteins (Toprim domain)
MDKLRVRYPVIVEGKYDKIALSALFDTPVFSTGGFAVFRSDGTRALLRRLAEAGPVILLTDSDGGGRQIRSFLSQILPPDRVIHLYIPQIPGKEKRKATPGKAGLLGVEGMTPALLRDLFAPFLVDASERPSGPPITKTDLYALGLSGGAGSAEKRAALSLSLSLPADLPANALLDAVNLLFTRDEFLALVARSDL